MEVLATYCHVDSYRQASGGQHGSLLDTASCCILFVSPAVCRSSTHWPLVGSRPYTWSHASSHQHRKTWNTANNNNTFGTMPTTTAHLEYNQQHIWNIAHKNNTLGTMPPTTTTHLDYWQQQQHIWHNANNNTFGTLATTSTHLEYSQQPHTWIQCIDL